VQHVILITDSLTIIAYNNVLQLTTAILENKSLYVYCYFYSKLYILIQLLYILKGFDWLT